MIHSLSWLGKAANLEADGMCGKRQGMPFKESQQHSWAGLLVIKARISAHARVHTNTHTHAHTHTHTRIHTPDVPTPSGRLASAGAAQENLSPTPRGPLLQTRPQGGLKLRRKQANRADEGLSNTGTRAANQAKLSMQLFLLPPIYTKAKSSRESVTNPQGAPPTDQASRWA